MQKVLHILGKFSGGIEISNSVGNLHLSLRIQEIVTTSLIALI